MEVLGGEALVALAIEPLDAHRRIRRHPLRRRQAQPTIVKTGLALGFEAPTPPPERPLAHPQQLRRLQLAQLPPRATAENVPKLHQAHALQNLRPSHPRLPSRRRQQTGQIVRYLIRTDPVLPTTRTEAAFSSGIPMVGSSRV